MTLTLRTGLYQGVFSVVSTPFLPTGDIDWESLERLIEQLLKAGVDGLTALGVMSETPKLRSNERQQILRTIVSLAGDVPVVVGATADGLAPTIENIEIAHANGAAAVMISPPRLPRASPSTIKNYFSELASASELDIVVQDYPAASGLSMDAALLAEMALEIPTIAAIKLEDPPTPPKIAAVVAACARPLPVFGGLGGAFLFEELLAGSAGAMTGFAFPEVLVSVIKAFRAGRLGEAADLFYPYVPVLRLEAQEGSGIAVRKEFLRRRGVFHHNELRTPGPSLDAQTALAIDYALSWSGLDDPKSDQHAWN